MEELKYLNALNCIQLLGPARIELLLNRFGSAKGAWEASEKEWADITKLVNIIPKLIRKREAIDPDKEWLHYKTWVSPYGAEGTRLSAPVGRTSRPPYCIVMGVGRKMTRWRLR